MSSRTHSSKLIPIAALLLLAISWAPVAVCTAMPVCPMTSAQAAGMDGMGMDGMGHCHSAQAPERDFCDSPQIEAAPCCDIDSQPAETGSDELLLTSSTSLPVAGTPVVAMVPTASPAPSPPDRTPAPKAFGRALLSQHQTFLL